MSLSGKTPNFANSLQNMNQNIYKNICAKYRVDTCSEEACRGVFQKTALLKNPIYDSMHTKDYREGLLSHGDRRCMYLTFKDGLQKFAL